MSELNQMQEIEKLYARPKEYKIPKEAKEGGPQATLKFIPLGLEHMSLMDMKEDASISEISKKIPKLIAVTLGIEEEQAKLIILEHLSDVMDAFKDVNKFGEEDMKKTGIKEFMAQKRKLIAEQKKDGPDKSTKE